VWVHGEGEARQPAARATILRTLAAVIGPARSVTKTSADWAYSREGDAASELAFCRSEVIFALVGVVQLALVANSEYADDIKVREESVEGDIAALTE